MSVGRSFARSWGRGLAVVLLFLVGAAVVWFAYRRGAPRLSEGEREPPAVPALAEREASAHTAPPTPVEATALAVQAPTAVPADPYAGMYAGPGPDDPAGPGMLPHPITPEHVRLYRDVELLDSAWRAMERRDFERARSLLREHASEYASKGYDDINDGLTLLADCMEHPSTSTRERAQRFYEQRTSSTTRRRIRKHCL